MVVGGPNARTDFHLQTGEEFFYQLKGDLTLHLVVGGVFKVSLLKLVLGSNRRRPSRTEELTL
jgi:3-hydroxyanthranilate 3,4-dioxygenase